MNEYTNTYVYHRLCTECAAMIQRTEIYQCSNCQRVLHGHCGEWNIRNNFMTCFDCFYGGSL